MILNKEAVKIKKTPIQKSQIKLKDKNKKWILFNAWKFPKKYFGKKYILVSYWIIFIEHALFYKHKF